MGENQPLQPPGIEKRILPALFEVVERGRRVCNRCQWSVLHKEMLHPNGDLL
jgi:hypothetical protein